MNETDELPKRVALLGDLEKLSAAQFARANPRPALHLTLELSKPRTARVARDPEAREKSPQEKSYERTATIPPSPSGLVAASRYHDRIAFLAKRAGNPFPNMISVGRALNNDLVVMLSTMSKIHGYFMCEGDAWSFIDHGSKNGTRINDQPLQPREKRALQSGDRIRLGLELHAVFFAPEKLYDFLRRSSSAVSP